MLGFNLNQVDDQLLPLIFLLLVSVVRYNMNNSAFRTESSWEWIEN